MNRRPTAEGWAAGIFACLAAIGWAVHSVLLSLSGTLGVLTVVTLWVWQRECLTNVSFRRTLSRRRAMFAEEITVTVEVVNDKLLPLPWLHITDDVPRGLTIRGGTVEDGASQRGASLHLLLAMLPFARVRRHLTILCDQRGSYTFGPTRLESGDPIGYGRRTAKLDGLERLLVYPKVFLLEPPGVASRMLLGDQRSRSVLLGDPSRVADVRDYRPGDPLKHVDWRASARSPSLLVRVFEPTTTLRVAVFVDLHVPRGRWPASADLLEFTVAVAASVVSDLAGRQVAVGLYSAGTVEGRTLIHPPSTSPSALPDMLESLARMSPYATVRLADVLASEGVRFQTGTSIVVVAADFPEPTVEALADLRRRLAVTSLWVRNDTGAPPPVGTVDAREEVSYVEGWKQRSTLELAG